MKKITFTILTTLIFSAMTFAQDFESYTALKVTGDNVPVIGGTIDPIWENAVVVALEKVPESGGVVHSNITVPNPEPADYSAEISMLWNESGIFFLFTIVDDKVVIFEDYDAANTTPADKWWADDNINLLFSKDLVNTSFTQWEFAWQPGIDQEEKLSSDDWLNAALIDISLVSSAWHQDGTTWTLETFIDWQAFADGSAVITEGMNIYLEARARDDDDEVDNDPWESMFQWSTVNYGVENDGVNMGEVTLSAQEAQAPSAITSVSAQFNQLSLFPNPSTGNSELQLTLEQNGNVMVDVYDVTGAFVKGFVFEDRQAAENRIPLNLEDLNSGTYLIQVQSNNNSGVLKYVRY